MALASESCPVRRFPHARRAAAALLPPVMLTVALATRAAHVPPRSLQGVPVPPVPGLLDGPHPIVTDRASALRLGKALFWDMATGSDGIACASCHFHAGADRRTRNQLDSGSRHGGAESAGTFEPLPSGPAGGPDHDLRAADFPLFQFQDPADKTSRVLFSTDDGVSSAGALRGRFLGMTGPGSATEACEGEADALFHRNGANTRRVSTRNAPSVYNAAFNHRNFWDGRANHLFNGASAFGPRDPDAGILELRDGRIQRSTIRLPNASLASQAVAPPLDDREMACRNRRFPDLGRRLLGRRPLDSQAVSPDDSLLGPLRDGTGRGLATTYADLTRKAFDRRFWVGSGDFGAPPGGPPYSQLEANFAFFFGLAIQLYESTLVSDQTRFDGPRDRAGYPRAYESSERRGLKLFAHECLLCHLGPTFTAAAHPRVYLDPDARERLVDRRVINGDFDGDGVAFALLDVGYANTSVTPTEQDPGLGGTDPWGNPLSFTVQYLASLADPVRPPADPIVVLPCDFTTGFDVDFKPEELTPDPQGRRACPETPRVPAAAVLAGELGKLEQGRLPAAVKGAFKIPGLRNVELTGPYMHNGSMKNLEEVLAFYDRGGNVANPHHIGNLVFPRPFSAGDKADLLAFLKTLTDERVRWERAPFDHPELRVPHGHEAGPAVDGRLPDRWLVIPAVGRNGRTAEQGPLLPFESYLRP